MRLGDEAILNTKPGVKSLMHGGARLVLGCVPPCCASWRRRRARQTERMPSRCLSLPRARRGATPSPSPPRTPWAEAGSPPRARRASGASSGGLAIGSFGAFGGQRRALPPWRGSFSSAEHHSNVEQTPLLGSGQSGRPPRWPRGSRGYFPMPAPATGGGRRPSRPAWP